MTSQNPGSPQRLNDEEFMRRCIQLAKIAFERGDSPVGSIVVNGNAIIAEGIETLPSGTDVHGHAELIAVQKAVNFFDSKLLNKTTLYTTAEPCFMCSYVIRNAEVARVVYCLDTPLIGGVTSDYPILIDDGLDGWKPAPEIVAGILAPEFSIAKNNWKTTSS